MLSAGWLVVPSLSVMPCTAPIENGSSPQSWAFITTDGPFAEPHLVEGVSAASSRLGRLATWRPASEQGDAPLVQGFIGPGGARVILGGGGGWVRSVSVTFPAESALTVVEAYSETGIMIGTRRGGPGTTVTLSFPGRIHRVVVRETQGEIEPPRRWVVAPGPATLGALGIALMSPLTRRRRGTAGR